MDDKELKNVLDSIVSEIQKLSEKMDSKFENIESRLYKMEDDIETIRKDVKRLKKDTIKLQAMDESILDEVERVHEILDKHIADPKAHTA